VLIPPHDLQRRRPRRACGQRGEEEFERAFARTSGKGHALGRGSFEVLRNLPSEISFREPHAACLPEPGSQDNAVVSSRRLTPG